MEELGSGLWWWTASHPDWTPEDLEGGAGWEQVVSSFALAAGVDLVLFDPRSMTGRARPPRVPWPPAIMITILWHVRRLAAGHRPVRGSLALGSRAGGGVDRQADAGDGTFLPGDELPGGVEAIPMLRIEEIAYLLPSHNVVVVGDTILRHGERADLCPPTWVRRSETFDAARRLPANWLRARLTASCSRMDGRGPAFRLEGRSSCKRGRPVAALQMRGRAGGVGVVGRRNADLRLG